MRQLGCRSRARPNDYQVPAQRLAVILRSRLSGSPASKGEMTMQFLVYDPNQNPEASAPPSPEFMAEMGAFIQEATQAGVVVATGALQPKGTRLRLSGGQFTVTDGPFIEVK